jgi:hypothetical protein
MARSAARLKMGALSVTGGGSTKDSTTAQLTASGLGDRSLRWHRSSLRRAA